MDGTSEPKLRGGLLVLGLLLVFAGFLAIGLPFATAIAVDMLVAWVLIVSGIVQMAHSFSSREWGGSLLRVLWSLLYLIAGFSMLVHPLRGVATLTIFLAVLFFVEGALKIAAAIQLRSAIRWGWLLVNGILALLIGDLIWMRWPSSSLWAIGLLVGVNILFTGFSMVMTAFAD
jgi:uncharacterized membrane protein HdeD (DUF308 family)